MKKNVRGRALVTSESVDRFLGKPAGDSAEVGGPGRSEPDWDGFEVPALDLALERRRNKREEREAA